MSNEDKLFELYIKLLLLVARRHGYSGPQGVMVLNDDDAISFGYALERALVNIPLSDEVRTDDIYDPFRGSKRDAVYQLAGIAKRGAIDLDKIQFPDSEIN